LRNAKDLGDLPRLAADRFDGLLRAALSPEGSKIMTEGGPAKWLKNMNL
jgi:hypothetical protein